MNEQAAPPRELTPAHRDEFAERGFTVVREVFDTAEVDRMRRAFERLEQTARRLGETTMHRGTQFVVERNSRGDLQIKRIVWCGGAEQSLSALGADRRLVGMACRLIGCEAVSQLINQAHFKFPGDEVTFEWHQDSKHRRYGTDLWTDVTGRGSFVETTTAVDPMTDNNGPLQFIPGSNELGHVPTEPDGSLPDDLFDASEAVTLTLEPGDVALFGPYTIHGSGPNDSDHPRRLFLNGFAHPDANRRDYPGCDAGRMLQCPND